MEKKIENKNGESELRQDIITGDWVVIATGRAKRPEDFVKKSPESEDSNAENCFFCKPEKTGQEKDVLIYHTEDDDWTLRVFPNKYPAFSAEKKMQDLSEGPYNAISGTGYHELVVTRDHFKHMALFDTMSVAEIFDAYQERYLDLMNKRSVNFIGIYHNHGKEAGASVFHPHSQLVAIPVISPYLKLELDGSAGFYKKNGHNVFEIIAEYESAEKTRVIFENEYFIAFCPFSSRAAFEVWVMPKRQNPYFERITDKEKMELAEVFKKSMKAIYDALGNPPYNFYIHTAPCDGRHYPHYRWHIEILPHTATWAGFELQTGIEISTIQPEVAAEFLRKKI